MKLVYGYTLYLTEDPFGGECGVLENGKYETPDERDEIIEQMVDDLVKEGFECVENFRPFHKWDIYDGDGRHCGECVLFHKMEVGA